MPAKKAPKQKPVQETDIIDACFAMIAAKGLGKTRLSALAETLKVPLASLYAQYPTVDSILWAFCDQVDQRMIADCLHGSYADKRELYFDMIMARLDAMQTQRAGVVAWIKSLSKHPDLWTATLRRTDQSLSLMLDIAKDSPLFPVKKIGLAAIYAATLRAWVKDDSPDMAKTMATLDKALGRGESIVKKYMSPPKKAA